jgi:hypothetical protein
MQYIDPNIVISWWVIFEFVIVHYITFCSKSLDQLGGIVISVM